MRLSNRWRWALLPASAALLSGFAVRAETAASAPAMPAVIADDDGGGMAGFGEDLYLEVEVNGMSSNQLAHFSDHDDQLYASSSTLKQLGFVLPASTKTDGSPVRLNSLPGVQIDYNAARQHVAITAPLSLLDLRTTQLNKPDFTAPKASASPGLLLNYDLYGTAGAHNTSSLNAYTELRAFSGAGVLSNTALTQAYLSPTGEWVARSARLDTSWQTSFPEDMLTLTVGDTLSSSLAWSRATHIAGVQLSRNFSLQPYRITTPVPAFLGEASVPSAVELYVNGIKQYSGKVPAGPFQLNTIPSVSGNGDAQVVLTDAFGRTTTVSFPFYAADSLLQKGLSDWSAEVGVVRKSYGLKSFDYGHDPAASGTFRYGVSDNFTAQAHAETISGLTVAGGGGSWLLGNAGVINGSVAHSSGQSASGSQFNLGYNWRNDLFNFAIDGTRTQGEYRDVASLYGAAPPSITARALLGLSTQQAGTFSVSYLHLRYPGQDASRYASAYWFRSFGSRSSLSLSLNQNLDDSSDRSIFLGVSISLDSRTMLSGSMQRSGNSTNFSVDANRPIPGDGGFGWRAQATEGGGQSGGLAEMGYRNNYGQFSGGLNAIGNDRYAYADASGAVVLMGGEVFASRRIDDAFAVVSTSGVANVPVKLENRVIGSTNADGMLLVSPLNAWQKNQLAIDPMQLPADVRIGRVKANATPTDRAGTLVAFDIQPIRAASVILVDAAGKPLALGSHVRLRGQNDSSAMVGFDGAVYLDTLAAHNTLDVDTADGACSASFDYHKNGDSIPEIGPLTCRKGASP